MTTTVTLDIELTADLLALIADRAAAGDESGHLDPEVVAALAATGINRLLLPTELGGLAVPPRRIVEIVEQLAAIDGSTAWAAAIGFGTNHFAGYLPPDGAADVFTDPDQSNAAMFAPLGEVTENLNGTLRLTGRWPFTSNCEQAAWLGLAARFPGEPAPRPGVRAQLRGDHPPHVGRRRPAGHGQQRHLRRRHRGPPPAHLLVRRPALARGPTVAPATVRGPRPAPWRPCRSVSPEEPSTR